jgi:hypothetical protein
MSGETELTLEQKLNQLDAALDKYEKSKGLPDVVPHGEAQQYLNINQAQLAKLTPEQCGEAAVMVAQFGFHLQKVYNREIGVINWCEDCIQRTITPELKQYNAPSADERKRLAIRGNEYASKLQRLKSIAQARVDRLSYLPAKVEWLSRTLLELQQTKRRGNGHA